LLGSLIGKKKANYGAEFLFELFQNRRLNQHLMYTLFDELFKTVFPEIESENEKLWLVFFNIFIKSLIRKSISI